MFQIEVWKLQEYFVYPQGACRIRKAAKPPTAAQYFKIFKPISWGERPAERRSRFIQRFLKETQKPRSPVAEGLRCCPVHGLQHRLHGFYSMRLPDLSLRGGQRPTWQSREGSYIFAEGFSMARPALRDCHVASLLAMTHQAVPRCTSAPARLNCSAQGAH